MAFAGPGASGEQSLGRSSNATTTAWAVTPGQFTEEALPDWFIDVVGHLGMFPLRAFGVGNSGDTFLVRLLGAWRQPNGNAMEYDVAVIAEFAVTLGDTTGAADRLVDNLSRYAWSMAATDGPVATAYTTASPSVANGADAAGDIAIARIEDLGQPDKIGFDFDLDGGSGNTPTSANVLYRLVS